MTNRGKKHKTRLIDPLPQTEGPSTHTQPASRIQRTPNQMKKQINTPPDLEPRGEKKNIPVRRGEK